MARAAKTTTNVGTEYVGLCGNSDFAQIISSVIGNHTTGNIEIVNRQLGEIDGRLYARYNWQSSDSRYIAIGRYDANTAFYVFISKSGDAVVTIGSNTANIIMSGDYIMYGTSNNHQGVTDDTNYGINFALVKGYNVVAGEVGNSLLIIGMGSQLMLYDPDAETYLTGNSSPLTYEETHVNSAYKYAVAGPIFSAYSESVGLNSRRLFGVRSAYTVKDELSINDSYFYYAGNGLLLAKSGSKT